MTCPTGGQADGRFERIFTAYQQPILSYLYRLVGNLERAEDLAQETFAKVYGALPRLPDDAKERNIKMSWQDAGERKPVRCFRLSARPP